MMPDRGFVLTKPLFQEAVPHRNRFSSGFFLICLLSTLGFAMILWPMPCAPSRQRQHRAVQPSSITLSSWANKAGAWASIAPAGSAVDDAAFPALGEADDAAFPSLDPDLMKNLNSEVKKKGGKMQFNGLHSNGKTKLNQQLAEMERFLQVKAEKGEVDDQMKATLEKIWGDEKGQNKVALPSGPSLYREAELGEAPKAPKAPKNPKGDPSSEADARDKWGKSKFDDREQRYAPTRADMDDDWKAGKSGRPASGQSLAARRADTDDDWNAGKSERPASGYSFASSPADADDNWNAGKPERPNSGYGFPSKANSDDNWNAGKPELPLGYSSAPRRADADDDWNAGKRSNNNNNHRNNNNNNHRDDTNDHWGKADGSLPRPAVDRRDKKQQEDDDFWSKGPGRGNNYQTFFYEDNGHAESRR